MKKNVKVVCYMGGTCGALVSSVIDARDASVIDAVVVFPDERTRLKRNHEFISDEDRDAYLELIAETYLSVPSHATDYHIRRKHNFIAIGATSLDDALWAAVRFKRTLSSHKWDKVCDSLSITTVEEYAACLLRHTVLVQSVAELFVSVADIRSGKLLDVLKTTVHTPLNASTYSHWLSLQR